MFSLEELKKRKLVQWALAYLAGAWVVLQLLDILAEPWGIGSGLLLAAQILLGFGFFATLVLAWYHGEQGRQRASGPELLMLAGILVIAGGVIALVREEGEARTVEADESVQVVGLDSIPERSIAVLPLDDNSPDPEHAYFADAMTEEITTALTKVPELRVIARNSAAKFAESGLTVGDFVQGELRAAHALEGSVQLVGDRARITVQLIDAATEEHLWSNTYDAELVDVLDVQVDIARRVAEELATTFSEREAERIRAGSTDDPEAYDLYLRAGDVRGTPDIEEQNRAIALLREAVARDSGFSLAHLQLGIRYYWKRSMTGEEHWSDSIRIALDRAIDTAEDPFGNVTSRVWRTVLLEEDYSQAIALLHRAVGENPSSTEASWMLTGVHGIVGNLAEAMKWGRHTITLDPLDPEHRRAVGYLAMVMRLDSLAENAYEKARELGSDPIIWQSTFEMSLLQSDYDRAERTLDSMRAAGYQYVDVRSAQLHTWLGDIETARSLLETVDDTLLRGNPGGRLAPIVAHVMLLTGDTARAEQLLQAAEQVPAAPRDYYSGAALELAVAAVRGDAEAATASLREAVGLGLRDARWIRASPVFSRVRDDPAFQAELRDVEQLVERQRRQVERDLARE